MRNKKLFLSSIAAALALSACSGLGLSSKQPAPTIYALHAGAETGQMPSGNRTSGVISVDEPTLPAGFETDQIALFLDGGRRLDYYSAAKWPAPLDQVLHGVIIQAGRTVLPKMIIDTPDLNVPANYRLAVKVNQFAPMYARDAETAPELRVSMTFTLVQLPQEKIMSSFTLQDSRPAAGNSLTAVTSGLEGLLQNTLDTAFGRLAKILPKKP
jgi:ABC-type uncharacterized transport system auxiliary subunit